MAVVLNQANRGPGTFFSSQIAVPTGQAIETVTATMLMTTAQRSDPTVEFDGGVEWFDSVDQVWKSLITAHFVCGNPDKSGQFPNPWLTVPYDWLAGKTVRGYLSLPRRLNIGVDVSWV